MSFTTIAATTLGLADGDQSPTPVSGTVRITPRHPAGTTTSGGVIATGPVIVTIAGGEFPSTAVPAREDSTALIEFHLYTADGPVRMPDTEIPLAPGATIDLRDHLSVAVDPATGQALARGPRGPGITDITSDSGVVTVEWEGGDAVEIPIPTAALATPTSDGLMPSEDKVKLDETPEFALDSVRVLIGDVEVPTAASPTVMNEVAAPDWAWAVADEAGQVALGVRPDGTTYTGGGTTALPYDVVLIIGQSNARGAGYPVPAPDPQDGIDQFPAANKPQAGQIIPAVDPLLHQDPGVSGTGFAIPFARRYRQEHLHRRVLIVPAAHGATGFSSSAPAQGGTWDWTAPDDGTNLAINAVRQTQDALAAAGTGARLVGILWHQGEGDGSIAADYHSYLDGLIAWMRAQLDAPDVPFVVGQMSPDRQGGTSAVTIDAAHQQTPARVERTAFAPTPAGLHNYGDATHLATRGLQRVGINFFDALERAEFNTPGAGPIGVENVHAVQVGSEVRVSFDPAWTWVTEYRVEWRDEAGTWTEAGVEHPLSIGLSATIPTTAAVEVRVTSINPDNESTPVVGPVIGGGVEESASADLSHIVHDDQGWNPEYGPTVQVVRTNAIVELTVEGLGRADGGYTGNRTVVDLPLGFRPTANKYPPTWRSAMGYVASNGQVRITNPGGPLDYFSITYFTTDPMPTGGQP